MAAAIKAINAKIRSNKVLDYVFSTRMVTISLILFGFDGWAFSVGIISLHASSEDD